MSRDTRPRQETRPIHRDRVRISLEPFADVFNYGQCLGHYDVVLDKRLKFLEILSGRDRQYEIRLGAVIGQTASVIFLRMKSVGYDFGSWKGAVTEAMQPPRHAPMSTMRSRSRIAASQSLSVQTTIL